MSVILVNKNKLNLQFKSETLELSEEENLVMFLLLIRDVLKQTNTEKLAIREKRHCSKVPRETWYSYNIIRWNRFQGIKHYYG